MKIAFIGIRGIPVIYSAYETFAENLAVALIKKNYDVTVYCRSPHVKKPLKKYRGVGLIVLPTLRSKYFETFIHTSISTIHACLFAKYDIIYFWGVGNAVFTLLPKLLGIKTVINVDGLDWKREKWNWVAKKYLKYSEYVASKIPDIVITDSLYIQKYYEENYQKKSTFIPYSFHEERMSLKEQYKLFQKYGLKREKYIIWVGRIIPDNHLDDLVVAFKKVKTHMKCLIVGDDFYNNTYKQYIYKLAKKDKRIIFTGYIERKQVYALERNSLAYIETKRSGSTHQSLVEALGLGCFIIANDYHVNKQILGTSAIYYKQEKKHEDLNRMMVKMVKPGNKKLTYLFRVAAKKLYSSNYGEKLIMSKYKILLNQFEPK